MIQWHQDVEGIVYVEAHIFEGPEGFYFEDESQTDLCGPYTNIEGARNGLTIYEKMLGDCV